LIFLPFYFWSIPHYLLNVRFLKGYKNITKNKIISM
jgi:hypothetical protein